MDDIITTMAANVYTSTHQMEVVGGSGIRMIDGLYATAISHVVTRSRIAQLVVLVRGRKTEIPGCGIVQGSLFSGHRLPLQGVTARLHEIGTAQAPALVLVLDVILHAVLIIKGIIGQGIANLARSRQTILVQCLGQNAHHTVEVVRMGVLVCTITSIGP